MGDVWQEFQKLTPNQKVTVIEQAVGELGANVGIDYLTGKGATSLLSNLKNSIRNVMKNEAFMARLKSETGAIYLGGAGKAGKIVGSTNGLTTAEKQVVDDLVVQGKTVEIIPKDPQSKIKTPDFKIDGVKTELKTLQNPNVNTGITRVQDGFKQSGVVIVDGRSAGLTKAQAIEIKNRTIGSYTSKGQSVPGKFEIWTNEGVVTYP